MNYQEARGQRINEVGFWAGVSASAATLAYDAVQIAQMGGVLRPPLDGILIYATSLCIVVPFMLEVLALHQLTVPAKRFWSHAAVVFTTMYAVFVTTNYVVQLATVIPARLNQAVGSIQVLDQTLHSMYWDYDALGYITMGFTTLFAAQAMSGSRFERWANARCSRTCSSLRSSASCTSTRTSRQRYSASASPGRSPRRYPC